MSGRSPKYHEVSIKLPNGFEFKTKSTFDGDVIISEYEESHPAWNEGSGNVLNEKGSSVKKFREKNTMNYGAMFAPKN